MPRLSGGITRWNNACKCKKSQVSLHQRLAATTSVQLTNVESSSYTFYNRQLLIGLCPPKYRYLIMLFTTVNLSLVNSQPQSTVNLIPQSSYLQPSITSSDCVLLQAANVGILGTFSFASIIPSCSLTFASVIKHYLRYFYTLLN